VEYCYGEKMQSLEDNDKLMLEENSQGQPVVDCCWVYKLKNDPKKEDKKLYKARLVAKEYTQEKSVVLSPVAKLSTIQLICALVAILGLMLHQMNVVTAFFYGALKKTIYIRQPQGFAKNGK
jgi:hypothetical protein